MIHNCLKNDYRATDYIKGVNSPLTSQVNLPDGYWTPYFHFRERQKFTWDNNCCVIFSAQESSDAYMDYLISSGGVSIDTIEFFNKLGFMDSNSDDQKAHFHSSARYWSVLTGNGQNGNNLYDPWDVARRYGCIPWTKLPFDDTTSVAEYFAPISQENLNLGQQFLTGVGGKNWVGYHWIQNGGACPFPTMDSVRHNSPLCIGVNVGNDWNKVQPPAPQIGLPAGHSVANFDRNAQGEVIEDHYVPFEKTLVEGYPIPQVMGIAINIVPPPPAPTVPTTQPVTPTPANPAPAQNSQWIVYLNALTNWLNNLLNSVQGKVASNTINMNIYNSWISKTNWTLVATIVITITNAVLPFMSPDVQAIVTSVLGVLAVVFHIQAVNKAAISSATLGTPSSGQ